MNQKWSWYRKYSAFSLPESLANPLIWLFAIALVVIWADIGILLFSSGSWKVATAVVFPVVFLAVLIGLAFTVPVSKLGGKALQFIDVPKKRALILRWRFANKDIRDNKVDEDKEQERYIVLWTGSAIYSPWFYQPQSSGADNFVNLEPEVIPQRGIRVNAMDGVLVDVDAQVAVTITDPIAFVLNVVTREQMKKYTQEYLETALQRVTSVEVEKNAEGKLVPKEVTMPDGTTIPGWLTSSTELSKASDKAELRMGKAATAWMNHWISSGRKPNGDKEQNFGFEVKVKINAVNLPKEIRGAQERKAAAELEKEERVIEAEGQRKAIEELLAAGEQSTRQEREVLIGILLSDSATLEMKKVAAETLSRYAPNMAVLHALIAGIPALENIMEQFTAGRRSAVSSKGKKGKGGKGKASEDEEDDEDEDTNAA